MTETGTCTSWIGALKYSDSPQVVELLTRIGDRYNIPARSDSLLNGCITALCGIYERSRQGWIGEYLRKKYQAWDDGAQSLFILRYPFGEEIVPQLRDALSGSASIRVRQAAAQRIAEQPEVWEQLKSDVYTRLGVETDETTRCALDQAKKAMETPK